MKFVIKSIISLIVISLCVTARIETATKVHEYNKGFDGTSIWFREDVGLLDHKNEKESVKCFFNPKAMVDKNGKNEFALIFKFTKQPSAFTRKYLNKIEGNTYALYYRNIPNAKIFIGKRDSFGSGRRLDVHFVTDDGTWRELWVFFPDPMVGHYIGSYELTKTVSAIVEGVAAQVPAIESSKKVIIGEADALKQNHEFLLKAKEGKSAIDKQIKEAEEKQKNLKSITEAKQKEYETLQAEVNKIMETLKKAEQKAESKKNEIEEISNRAEAVRKSIQIAKNNNNDQAKQIAEIEKEELEHKGHINAEVAKMKKITIQTEAKIDACANAAITTMDSEKTREACNKFRPAVWK